MRIQSRPRLVTSVIVVVSAGVATGFAAVGRIGPFDGLGVISRHTAATVSPAPLPAGPFYPVPTQPATLHQIIEIPDPPVIVRPSLPPRRGAASVTQPTPQPAPAAAPMAPPCPDDCQGGGGDS